MSLLYSNRFIKSIEPHVKLVALGCHGDQSQDAAAVVVV